MPNFNVKGVNFIAARQQLIYLIKKRDIDIIALQETHINYTGREQHGDFTFSFTSLVEDDARKQTEGNLENRAEKRRKRLITENEAKQERMSILNRSAEKLGVGFVYRRSKFFGTTIDISSLDNRFMTMTVHTTPLKLQIINVYAPHSGHTLHTKPAFYDKLNHVTQDLPAHHVNLVLEVSTHASWKSSPKNSAISDPILDLSHGQLENRQKFVDFLSRRPIHPF